MEIREDYFDEFEEDDIISPNEPHLACVLLLDTSVSMRGKPIDRLNEAIIMFKEQTMRDPIARRRVDIAIVEFSSGAHVIQDFVPLPQMETIPLLASGMTDMGQGINLAIDLVKERNLYYDSVGVPCHPSWIFMITDGLPTDSIRRAKQRIEEEENKGRHGKLKFWCIGVPGYDEKQMRKLSKRCIKLKEKEFQGIFQWLSESMSIISVSRVGENPDLPMLPEEAMVDIMDF